MIALRCACGKKLQVPNTMAGRTGKCPGCGGPVPVPREGYVDADGETIADDNTALELGDDPNPPKGRPPAAAPAAPTARRKGEPPGPRISCPRCKKTYGEGAIFCPECAVDIRTGKPVAGVVPGHMSAPRAPRSQSHLWLVIRAFFGRPLVRLVVVALLLGAAFLAYRHFTAPMK